MRLKTLMLVTARYSPGLAGNCGSSRLSLPHSLPGCLHRAAGREVPGKVGGTTGSLWSPGTWYPMISPLQEGSAFHLRDPVLGSSHSFSGLSGTGSTGGRGHSRAR